MTITHNVFAALPLAALITAGAAHADGYDSSLDLSGAANTYIESPTGNFDSYPGYVSVMDQLYLQPLGDTQTPSLALADMPSNSYSYGTTVPQGAQDVETQVLADYHAGELSAAHPDVILGYSYSTVADAEAMTVLHADGVPTDDLDFVLVGNTSQPVTGFIENFVDNPSYQWIIDLLGFQDLEGLITPTTLYPVDSVVIAGDEYPDYTADNSLGNLLHALYPGLDAAEINGATETTDGLLNTFTVNLDSSEVLTAGLNALDSVYGL